MKIFKIIFGIILIQLGLNQYSFSQIISDKESSKIAKSRIHKLNKGTLIVPLFRQNSRFEQIREMANNPKTSTKNRKSLLKKIASDQKSYSEFNKYLIQHFSKAYRFSKVHFIYDDDLQNFNLTTRSFINPKTLEIDSTIVLNDTNYFFLKYYKTSGIASSPENVRFFFISDKNKNVLKRPFPNSPGRKSSFSMRFRDLFNINTDPDKLINMLVVKLNSNLVRYLNKQNKIL